MVRRRSMKATLNIPKELITHIDIMNTLNGGTGEPSVRITLFERYREVVLKVPGVPRDQVKVEINNNKLTAYYFTLINTQDMEFPVTKVLYDKAIPYYVDIRRISVREDGGLFVIRLPFNELANGYKRDLSMND